MAMVVRSNLLALNANRQLGMNSSQASKSLEKLSSGFRINRASDDAAGLAISEKMKAQITGLNQASSNSQDGISLVQTAEGALGEVHSMLNRMIELATKSSNGTISDDVDREAIQDEVTELLNEIDRIGESTNFNGINLLDGTMATKLSAIKSIAGTVGGAAVSGVTSFAGTAFKATVATLTAGSDNFIMEFPDKSGKPVKLSFANVDKGAAPTNATELARLLNANKDFVAAFGSGAAVANANKVIVTAKAVGYIGEVKAAHSVTANTPTPVAITPAPQGRDTGMKFSLKVDMAVGDTIDVGGKTYTFGNAKDSKTNTFTNKQELVDMLKGNGVQLDAKPDNLNANAVLTFTRMPRSGGGTSGILTLQVGDTNDLFNKVDIHVDNIKTSGLKIDTLNVGTQTNAGNAIQSIRDAINVVSTNRGTLGAVQNRLEHAIANLDSTSESMSGANSRIRDTDMAKEMMNYTKMNVLTQSAQSMLAQANQQPQSILQLLQ